MNLIRNEKEKEIICRQTKEIALMRTRCDKQDDCRESYYVVGDELNLYLFDGIIEYSPETPSDLELFFNKLWKKRQTQDMQKLSKVCTIAAMKNRDFSIRKHDGKISTAVYEF